MRKIPAPEGLAGLYATAGQAEIGRRYGVDRTVVRRWLREAQIPIRPMRDVRIAQVNAMTYEQHIARTAKSRSQIKGRPRSEEWHLKRALGVQRAAKMSRYEAIVFEFTRRMLGYDPVPQYAVGKFNIDIALPQYKFGIEVDGGLWHTRHSPRKLAQDQAKMAFISPLGWQIFRISARNPETLNRQLPNLANLLRVYARPLFI